MADVTASSSSSSSSSTSRLVDRLTQRDLHARACAIPTRFQSIPPSDVNSKNTLHYPTVNTVAPSANTSSAEDAAVSLLRARFSAVVPTPEHSSKAFDMLRESAAGGAALY